MIPCAPLFLYVFFAGMRGLPVPQIDLGRRKEAAGGTDVLAP